MKLYHQDNGQVHVFRFRISEDELKYLRLSEKEEEFINNITEESLVSEKLMKLVIIARSIEKTRIKLAEQ
jgi:hypothetical protein